MFGNVKKTCIFAQKYPVKFLIYLTHCLLGISFCSLSAAQEESSLLWKIYCTSLPKPSYLFGTYHTVPYQFLDNVPGFYKAFHSAGIYVGEIDPLSELPKSVIRRIIMPSDTTYKDLLKKTDLIFLDSVLLEYTKMSIHQMNIRPSLISFMLATALIPKIKEEIAGDNFPLSDSNEFRYRTGIL